MDKGDSDGNEQKSLDDQLLDVKGLDYVNIPAVRLKGEKLLHFVKDDLEEFVDTYSQLKSLDFRDFVNTWKDNSMQYIFSGRSSEWEMEFFVARILIFAKDLLVTRRNKFEQVGALYLLYIIYFSQPLVDKVKIRVEHSDFKKLLCFIKEMKRSDVAYAFVRLCAKRAFSYVATSLPRSPENIEPSVDSDDEVEVEKIVLRKDILKKINAHRVIKKHNKYKEILSKLSEFDEPKSNFENTSGDLFKKSTYQPSFTQKSVQDPKDSGKHHRTMEFMDHLAEGFLSSEEEENEGDLFVTPTIGSSDSSDDSPLSNDEDSNSSTSGDQTDGTNTSSGSPGDDIEFGSKDSNSDESNCLKDEANVKRSKSSKSKNVSIKKMKCISGLQIESTEDPK